jgi:hypothetical protein
MKLSLPERFALLDVLPQRVDRITLFALEEVSKKLLPSKTEIADWDIKYDGAQISWDDTKIKEADIDIGIQGMSIIRSELKRLDETKQLSRDPRSYHLSFWMKFMEKDAPPAKE